jgi:hypothetical protein
MNSGFEAGQIDKIIERINEDPTGKVRQLVNKLVDISKAFAKEDIPLEELATLATAGWYMGADPGVEEMFKFIMMASAGNTVN